MQQTFLFLWSLLRLHGEFVCFALNGHNEVEELGNVRLFSSMWVKHIEEFKLPQHFSALHLRQATACSQNCDASSNRQHLVDFVFKAGTHFLPYRIRIKFRFRPS